MVDLSIEFPAVYSIATIAARKNADPSAIGAALGIEMPDGSSWTGENDLAVIGTGPGIWLALRSGPPLGWDDDLRHRLAGLASISDQSGAYVLIRLAGADAARLLQRGASIDLHPVSFAPGSAATTSIAHIGVVIRQLDAGRTFEIATFRSYADSFRRWLDQAALAL